MQVVGGCTYRIFRTTSRFVVLDVLVMAVAQEAGVCGLGHGTRLINYVKHLTSSLQTRRDIGCFVVAQAGDSSAHMPSPLARPASALRCQISPSLALQANAV
jgi:hypothetical protein